MEQMWLRMERTGIELKIADEPGERTQISSRRKEAAKGGSSCGIPGRRWLL